MSWGSWAEFFAMGGQGAYVWSAFVVCAVAMALEPWLLTLRRCNIVDYLRRGAGRG
ncbi:MAG TPA: heme exporter protein CcmD [Burkholderiales bacterium]|nr:heme exporter protein CcmD [Burkholderiales bacterium]